MPKNENHSIERKVVPFEKKGVDLQKSEFEGYSAGIGNEDFGRDIITPGAFTKTIQERIPTGYIKFLDNHNGHSTRNVWGTVADAREEAVTASGENAPTHKLWSRFSVSKADPDAQVALQKIAEGHLDQLSIGYKPIRVEYEKDEGTDYEEDRNAWVWGQGTRIIKELQLWEVSVVIWGMNPEARIIGNSLNRLTEFAQKAAIAGVEIPEDQVKNAIMALNQLIGKDATPDQQAMVRDVLADVGEAVDNVCSFYGKGTDFDPIAELLREYSETQAADEGKTFSIWVDEKIEAREEEEEKDCGCDEKEETSEEVEDKEEEVTTDDDVEVEEEKEVDSEAEEEETPVEETLGASIDRLADVLASFKEALSTRAGDSGSEEKVDLDADESSSDESKDSHTDTDSEQDAATDATKDSRSEHLPEEDAVALEFERMKLLELALELDN